jgi:predicted AAA+ superfamily ATPase
LLLIGPRQVGKTTILRSLASNIGQRVFEVNFWEDTDNSLKQIFTGSGNAHKILRELADHFGVAEINIKEDVLFIDEIQECKEAYSSLKSFKEKVPELRLLVTGSYLQLFLKNDELTKLPVGCVDEFYLGPMSFSEFLQNLDPQLYAKFENLDINNFSVSGPLHKRLFEKLNEYFFTGGLPEIVYLYYLKAKNHDSRTEIRKKQKDLIMQYVLDFQKYGKSVHIKKIDKIFQAIPLQLERNADESTSRFAFKDLGKDTKYNLLHWSFEFLKNTGLIIRSYIISKVDLPFRVHEELEERNIFKCFYFDMGLLGAALNSPINLNLEKLGSYKGYMAENFVAISLHAKLQSDLVSFKKSSKTNSAEVEFLIANDCGEVIPIEVKSSSKSLKSKSLDSFIKSYSPKRAIKLVPTQGGENSNSLKSYITLPLYMIDRI